MMRGKRNRLRHLIVRKLFKQSARILKKAENGNTKKLIKRRKNEKSLYEMLSRTYGRGITGHSMGGHIAYLLVDMVTQSRGSTNDAFFVMLRRKAV